MTVPIVIAIVAILVLKVVVCAANAAASHISRGRILRLADAQRRGARALDMLAERPGRLQAASSMVSALSYATSAVLFTAVFASLYETWPLWIVSAVGAAVAAVVLFGLGEALPRTLAAQNPEGVALTFAPAAARIVPVFYPLARVLNSPWRWALRLAVGERAAHGTWTGDAVQRNNGPMAEEDVSRGESEEALLEAVSDFTGKVVREVMVPRTDMTCLPETATTADAIELIGSLGYSRLPVYGDTVDDIRGVLYAKDLLAAMVGDPAVRPADIARPAYFVPETKPVQELLREMRTRTHIAVVADEYGGTAGLVTIEDLLEEIVGEIFDEYDEAVTLLVELDDGTVTVDARLSVDDLNERFDTAIELEAETVGGLFTEVAGHIPVVGESVEIEGLRITVEELQGTRIMRLAIRPVSADDEERPDA
ncbi:MAG TPA: hemolysin family protein [Coriobacteriia bacterium]|nr:hemolysin family protein [Coriobacteriia bacterium]